MTLTHPRTVRGSLNGQSQSCPQFLGGCDQHVWSNQRQVDPTGTRSRKLSFLGHPDDPEPFQGRREIAHKIDTSEDALTSVDPDRVTIQFQ